MKSIVLFLLAVSTSQVALAQFSPSGGHRAPVDTVFGALNAPDETAVVLTGNIVERMRSETYRFSDQTGEIRLDIGEEIWSGVKVGPDTQVRIVGETDRGLKGNEIWVHSVEAISASDSAD